MIKKITYFYYVILEVLASTRLLKLSNNEPVLKLDKYQQVLLATWDLCATLSKA